MILCKSYIIKYIENIKSTFSSSKSDVREGIWVRTPPCGVIHELPQSANESYDLASGGRRVLHGRERQEALAEAESSKRVSKSI